MGSRRSTAIGTAMTAASPVTVPSAVLRCTPRWSCCTARTGLASRTAAPSRRARPVATCWLPPATRQLGRQPNPAVASSATAAASWPALSPGRCLHPRQVGRQGGGLACPARGHLGEGGSRGGGRRPGHPGRALAHLCCADRPAAARLTLVVGHDRAREFQAEFGHHLAQHVVAVQHELGASLDDGPRIAGYELLRPHPAADPVAGLEHDNLAAALG